MLKENPGRNKSSVSRLRSEHTGFREEIEKILKRIATGEFEAAGARFDRLAARLATHDAREESLMRAANQGA